MQEVFSKAAREGDAQNVRALLADPRVDPADHNDYAIQSASANGHAEVVRALLADPRANPAANDNYAIQRASFFGHAEVVRVLLADPRVNPRGAIPKSTKECARIIATDDIRRGIEQYYELFKRFHPDIAREYQAQARLRQCYAVAWIATQECSWIDLVEPVSKRLKLLL